MDKLLNKKIKVKQSNELTEAAYYLSLKAKRVLWLCLMQTYFTASVSEDDDEMAVLGDSTFKVKVADYQQIFQVSRNQAIKDVKEGVFELSRSAVIFYPKEGRFDCVARPWLTEAGSRSARGIWEIEFNHKLLRYIYGLTNQFTTYSLRDCGSLRNPRTIRLYESLAQFKSSGLWVTTHAWLNDRFLLPESQQKNLAELKRSFLDPALKQINEKTPLLAKYSIDDSGKFLEEYVEKEILKTNPFETIDQNGIGKFVKIASELGRSTKPELKLGVCGEHGGDPASVKFFYNLGLNYVSCSPFRIPIAKLSLAQAVLEKQ